MSSPNENRRGRSRQSEEEKAEKLRKKRENDNLRRQNLRKNPEYYNKELAANADRNRKARTDENVLASQQNANTQRMQEVRKDEERRATEQVVNTQRHRDTRAIPERREPERASNTLRMQEVRKDEKRREPERDSNTQRMQNVRRIPARRAKEQAADTQSRQVARAIPERREKERVSNAQTQRKRRAIGTLRTAEQTVNTKARRERRAAKAEENFLRSIEESTDQRCNSCNRLCRPSSIKLRLDLKNLPSGKSYDFFIENCDRTVVSEPGKVLDKVQFCFTCTNKMKKGKLPKLNFKSYKLPPIAEELKGLSSIEERMVSPRIPFMQIQKLSWDGQYGIKGNIVNVPVDITTSTNVLPRSFNEMSTIQVRLKKRLNFKSAYIHETVRPKKVVDAAK